MNPVKITQISSPVVPEGNVKIITSVKSSDIIELYKQQSNVDVRRFFERVDKILVCECVQTGYRFYYPFTLTGDGEFYADVQNTKMKSNIDYYRDWSYDNEFAFSLINENDKVLEIGCGTGKFLEKLKSKNVSFVGLELNQQAVNITKEKKLDVRHELIEDFSGTNAEMFDHVCAFQVLEHVADINSFISASLKCLKKAGKLILGVPNNEPYFQRFNKYETFNLPPHHMGLWNLKAFKQLSRIFPMELESHIYSPVRGRVLADAYLRAKMLAGIKSLPRRHSSFDTMKMLLISPLCVLLSLSKHFTSGINGGYIAVSFRKL